MKKPHVLNRSMFNRGGTSAYGRGITSNLVTEEQRQRYNYGGRVGFDTGGDIYRQARERIAALGPRPTDQMSINEWKRWYNPKAYEYESGLVSSDPYSDVMGGAFYESPGDMADWEYYTGTAKTDDAPTTLEEGQKKWIEERSPSKQKQTKWDTAMKEIDPTYVVEGAVEETETPGLNEYKRETVKADLTGDKTDIKVDEESDVLGLTPEERTAMKSHMAFGLGAAGAGSKGKTWQEVIKDTLAGGSAVAAKAVDPKTGINLRRKYEEYGKASRKSAEEERAYEARDDVRIRKLIDNSKGAMDEITATEIIKLGSPIPKKTKDQIKKDKNLQSKIAGGAIYFDIDENAYSVVNKETGKRESIDDINQVITLKEDGKIL